MMFGTIQTIALQSDGAGAVSIVILLFFFAFIFAVALLPLAGLWKIFSKAGEPGWAAIIPFYNIYILTKITDNPAWFVIGSFVPLLNIYVQIVLFSDLAEAFGKGSGYAIGLFLLPWLFIPMLGFGSARYQPRRGGAARRGGGRRQQARRPRR